MRYGKSSLSFYSGKMKTYSHITCIFTSIVTLFINVKNWKHPNVLQLVNGQINSCTSTQWNTTEQ